MARIDTQQKIALKFATKDTIGDQSICDEKIDIIIMPEEKKGMKKKKLF